MTQTIQAAALRAHIAAIITAAGSKPEEAKTVSDNLVLANLSGHDSHGVGMCAMLWKPTGEMIGSAGLQPLDGTDEIEIGYSMMKDFWGRGIGTEAARAWLGYGFGDMGLERIVAVAHTENWASRHIMEKLGMQYEKMEFHYDAECAFYAISKAEFLEGGSHAS